MRCPVCSDKNFEIRNVGFVNCEWILRGLLKNREDSKISADGKTYDNKLYTFKETSYLKVFEYLEINAKAIKEA